jgi:hypothetical protein
MAFKTGLREGISHFRMQLTRLVRADRHFQARYSIAQGMNAVAHGGQQENIAQVRQITSCRMSLARASRVVTPAGKSSSSRRPRPGAGPAAWP